MSELNLQLGHAHIESLPKGSKNLTRLRHLDLHHSRELQALPELPTSLETLETLDAGRCVSLENVAFHSTASEQLKEKKKRVTFWNCLKLNEPSLKA
ncbi:disease resistance protein, partial [Trifolium medium]|nr:disease resistance protein [Trifolium medium]